MAYTVTVNYGFVFLGIPPRSPESKRKQAKRKLPANNTDNLNSSQSSLSSRQELSANLLSEKEATNNKEIEVAGTDMEPRENGKRSRVSWDQGGSEVLL